MPSRGFWNQSRSPCWTQLGLVKGGAYQWAGALVSQATSRGRFADARLATVDASVATYASRYEWVAMLVILREMRGRRRGRHIESGNVSVRVNERSFKMDERSSKMDERSFKMGAQSLQMDTQSGKMDEESVKMDEQSVEMDELSGK